jgi:hypothetical protein
MKFRAGLWIRIDLIRIQHFCSIPALGLAERILKKGTLHLNNYYRNIYKIVIHEFLGLILKYRNNNDCSVAATRGSGGKFRVLFPTVLGSMMVVIPRSATEEEFLRQVVTFSIDYTKVQLYFLLYYL